MKGEKSKWTLLDFTCLFIKVRNQMKWEDEFVFMWMNVSNPNFGGASPFQLIAMGRGHKVVSFVDAAIDQSKPPKELLTAKRPKPAQKKKKRGTG